ncbi:MAG: response regulator [Flavobacteriaceae bacterium]|nr:response regulator [Flavobacteriaceae bacterium]
MSKGISKRILLFLLTMIVIVLSAQVLLHIHLSEQHKSGIEAKVVSRQRMLTEQISRLIFEIDHKQHQGESYKEVLTDLKLTRQKWIDSHKAISQGSDLYQTSVKEGEEEKAIIAKLNPAFLNIKKELDALIASPEGSIEEHIKQIAILDAVYEEQILQLLYYFNNKNNKQFNRIQVLSWGLAALGIVIMFTMFYLIIKPALKRVAKQNTELKTLNQSLQKASEVKSDFLANVSHEIRTPMNGIIGMAGILNRTTLDSDQKSYVNTIKSSAENLMVIINDILDYSKLDSEKLRLEKSTFQLQNAVEEVVDLLKPSIQEKGLELIVYLEPEVSGDYCGDVIRLKQVLINLLNNAIKFTEKGEVLLTVERVADEGGFSQVKFEIKDTGIGMSAETLENLFESFMQADTSTTRKYGGTGLGLSICKKLVALMAGRIWAESELGKGSSFFFTTILESEEALAQSQKEEKLAGLRALVVDDNTTNLRILVKQLSNWGVRSTPFNSPELVVEIIKDLSKFDFCVMDMQMPMMDGEQLAAEIRKYYSVEELPIIVLSSIGTGLMNDADRLFSSYLTKPVAPSRLLNTLVNVIDDQKGGESKNQFSPNQKQASAFNKLRILIADDNELNLMVAGKILEQMGYASDRVYDGNEVIEKLHKQSYDLILMDIEMPGINGTEATKRIHGMFDKNDRPIIIGLSGNVARAEIQSYLDSGMDDFLPKPLNESDLFQKIEDWFEQD